MAVRPDTKQHNRRRHPLSRLGELFDASALGLITALLLCASFFMTWRGMRDFIVAREFADGAISQGLVFVIVATLSLAMYVALREMIAPYFVRGWWSAVWKRVIAGLLYAVLAFWSIGFGYGFWWSLVAGPSATEAGLQRTVNSVRQETGDMRARLAAASSVMEAARALSDSKADIEASRGGTCGVNSPAGAGPLARARNETQAQIGALANSVKEEWSKPLNLRLADLERDLQSALGDATQLEGDVRKARFEALGQTSQSAAAEIGSDATARGRTIAVQLRAKADQLSIAPDGGRVAYCYDLDLAAALTVAADELEKVYKIEVVPFRYVEGADGVSRAIEGLFASAGQYLGFSPKTDAHLGSGRDLIAMLAAIGVDLALFVFGLLRGSGHRRRRYTGGSHSNGEVIEQADQLIIEAEPRPALSGPDGPTDKSSDRVQAISEPRRLRIEANPSNVGIGTSAAGQRSQVNEVEQVDDLIEGVDGIYYAHSKDRQLAMQDAEIKRLRAELERLERLGYMATGTPGQKFDSVMHREVSRQPSEQARGVIIATVRPGYLLSNGRLHRVAEVIVSAGPDPYRRREEKDSTADEE